MQYGAMEPISQFQAAESPAADTMAVDVQLELQTTDGKASPDLLRKFFSDPVTSGGEAQDNINLEWFRCWSRLGEAWA